MATTAPDSKTARPGGRSYTVGVWVFLAAVAMEAIQIAGQAALLLAGDHSGPVGYGVKLVAAMYVGLALVVCVFTVLLALLALALCVADARARRVSRMTSYVTIVGSALLVAIGPMTLGAASAISSGWMAP